MSKTEARERCVLLFFEAEQKGQKVSEIVEELKVPPEPYCSMLIKEYEINEENVIEQIEDNIKNWSSDRLPAIDRAVLRMAITELLRSDETPVGTIISESVKLCENYSTDDSPRFVNGVLSTIAHKVRTVEMLKKIESSTLENSEEN
jgi:N utilization substance protein B